MGNNYHTILAPLQKSVATPPANQRTFSYSIKLQVFIFQLKEKKRMPLNIRLLLFGTEEAHQRRKKYKWLPSINYKL